MNNKRDDPNEKSEIDYDECSKEELLRFLRLRDKEITTYREDLSEGSLEKSKRIKSLQRENMRVSEKLRSIFEKDVVYAINNIVEDIESGKRIEISMLDDEDNVKSIMTVGGISRGEEPDKIYVTYMDFEPNENLVIIDEYKMSYIGTERFYYYKDDPYKTVYYGIILLRKENGRNVLVYTVVTDYFLRRKRSALMKVSNFVGNMGNNNRKVLKKRMEKLKNKNNKNKKKEAKN